MGAAGFKRYIGLLWLSTAIAPKASVAQWYWASNEDLCDYSNDWKLVFSEEFGGDAIDPAIWTTYAPFSSDGSDNCVPCRCSEDRHVVFRDAGVWVENGAAILKAVNIPDTWMGCTQQWRSGMLFSREPYRFNEGRFEIRCKLSMDVDGPIPAFWLFGDDGYEIDVFEFCGTDGAAKYSLHKSPPGGEWHDTYTDNGIASVIAPDTWHTYAVEWLDEWVIWYVDGQERHRRCKWDEWSDNDDCTLNGFYHEGMFPGVPNPGTPFNDGKRLSILASIGLGDPDFCCCAPLDNQFQHDYKMEIDYIRAWQNAGQFESGLSDLCIPANKPTVSAPDNAFCTPGEQIEFHVDGLHGDPIQWSITSTEPDNQDGNPQAFSVVSSSALSQTLEWNVPQGVGAFHIRAIDNESACPGFSTSAPFRFYAGAPFGWFGDQWTEVHCDDMGPGEGYWCVEPLVFGEQPEHPAPCYSFTTYYPATPDNPYNPQSPGLPQVFYANWIYRPYKVFVDGEEQTHTFQPDYFVELPDPQNPGCCQGVYGYQCEAPLYGCNHGIQGFGHWSAWGDIAPGTTQKFCAKRNGDYCHEVRIEASNPCGVWEQTAIVEDDCVNGPCDVIDPDAPDELSPYIHVTPLPADADFMITIGPEIDLSTLASIEVRDAVSNKRFEVIEPSVRGNYVNCSSWPAGVYWVTAYTKSGQVSTKIQIK